jgi:hypothetical protein
VSLSFHNLIAVKTLNSKVIVSIESYNCNSVTSESRGPVLKKSYRVYVIPSSEAILSYKRLVSLVILLWGRTAAVYSGVGCMDTSDVAVEITILKDLLSL